MKVRMLKSACGPSGSFQAGQEYDLTDEMAVAFLNDGAAVAVKDKAEASVLPAAETATVQTLVPKAKPRSGLGKLIRGDAA